MSGLRDVAPDAQQKAAMHVALDAAPDVAATAKDLEPDLERRFGGLRRLYGDNGYAALRAARIAIVGLGGVGSWAAEALARSGVHTLVLIDLDHVAESNINRQVQALTPTLGQAKVQALAERIALIHPDCRVIAVEEFVEPGNWPALLPDADAAPMDMVIDACDEMRAKEVLATWSLATGTPLIVAGAAGGKRRPEAVRVADLAEVTHDPLLATLRQRLRRAGVMVRGGGEAGKAAKRTPRSGLTCVYSSEPIAAPAPEQGGDACEPVAPVTTLAPFAPVSPGAPVAISGGDGSLNCHGYGSSVMVTAAFGLAAAGAAVERLLQRPVQPRDTGLARAEGP